MPDLKINVDVTGAQKGAADMNALASATTKTAQAAEKTAPANQKAATATKSLGDALSGLGSRNNDAKDVLEGVSAAAKGGEGALFGVAKAARAVFTIFAGGPIGIAVAGLALIGTAALVLADKLKTPKKSAEELAKELEEAKDAAEKLNQQKMTALRADLEGLERAAATATKRFEELQKQAAEIDNARESLELAQIANDSSLSDEAKARATATVQKSFADRRLAREVGADEFLVRQKQSTNNLVQNEETAAAGEVTAANDRIRLLETQRAAEIQRLEAAKASEIESARKIFARDGIGQAGAVRVAENRFEEGRKQVEEASTAKLAVARTNLAGAEQRLDEVNKRAIKTVEERIAAEETFSTKQKTREVVKPIDEQRREIETGKASAEARAKDAARQKQIDDLAQKSRDQQASGDFAGQDATVAEIAKLTPKGPAQPITPQKFTTVAPDGKLGSVAGQEIKALDADPVAQEVKALAENVSAKTTQGQASLDAAASTIAAATQAVTPPFDTSVLIENFGTFAQANQATHTATNARLTELASYVQSLAQMQQMQAQQIQSAANASR